MARSVPPYGFRIGSKPLSPTTCQRIVSAVFATRRGRRLVVFEVEVRHDAAAARPADADQHRGAGRSRSGLLQFRDDYLLAVRGHRRLRSNPAEYAAVQIAYPHLHYAA